MMPRSPKLPAGKSSKHSRGQSRNSQTSAPSSDDRDAWLATAHDASVIGVDEVGRGPLAGPVVAAAVRLDPRRVIEGLADSKTLTPTRRAHLAEIVHRDALEVAIAEATVEEIDELNILQATHLAMRRAVAALTSPIRVAYIDGNRAPDLSVASRCVVGGDALVPAISAASIVAKEYRDQLMCRCAENYPGYGFDRHKGYPTVAHRAALMRLGACPEHRRSFAPVRAALGAAEQGVEQQP